MQRHTHCAVANGMAVLAGAAGLFAVSGCAAVPAVNMVSGLLNTPQQAQPGIPSQDTVALLAQKLGITLPTQQPATTKNAVPGTTATATAGQTTSGTTTTVAAQ